MEIQVIGKQGVKLLAHHAGLGQESPVLLDGGEKMGRHIAPGEHQSLAAEGAHLGAADVEQVAQRHHIRQCYIRGRTHETVAQAGPIHIQGQTVAAAGFRKSAQLRLGVQGAEFGGVGDVDHAGLHQVLPHLVVEKLCHVPVQIGGQQLALHMGDGQHPVAGILNGPGLMDVDVAGIGGDDPLVAAQHAVDGDLVGLGAAGEEPDLQIVPAAGSADFGLGSFGVGIVPIAGQGNHVHIHQMPQHLGMGPLGIVRKKIQHKNILRK